MKTTLLYTLLALTIVLILSAIAMGQPGLPGGANGPAQAPIDGGLGLLAAAGGTYAWKKLRDRKKNEDIDL